MLLEIRVIVFQVVVKDQARDHVSGHADLDGGCARRVRMEHRSDVVLGKVEAILEEEGSHKGQLLEFRQTNRATLEQLPFGRYWKEFIDELVRIGEEIVIVVLVPEAIVAAAAAAQVIVVDVVVVAVGFS